MENERVRSAFGMAAGSYRGRIPYAETFFNRLADHLGLTGKERLLDLGCGDGSIMRGMTGRTAGMTGVDFSEAMLSLAPTLPDARYLHCSAEEFVADERAMPARHDLLTMGQSVHWLETGVLAEIIGRKLEPGARVITLGRRWKEETPWHPAFKSLQREFSSFETGDISGRRKLTDLGLKVTAEVKFDFPHACTIAQMGEHLASYASCAEKFAGDPEGFRRRVAERLGPYASPDGTLRGEALNWALIFKAP